MKSITFTCEVLTPMFLGDATGGAELRPPAIKAALRFWWRAIHAHLDLHKMHETETLIFGGGGDKARRSSFDVVIKQKNVNTGIAPKLPHKQQEYRKAKHPALLGGNFIVQFNLFKEKKFSEEKLIALMFIASTLGDLGARARRGMGAWKINKINNENAKSIDINMLVDKIKVFNANDYNISNNIIKIDKNKNYNHSYPYIKEIHFGQNEFNSRDSLLKKIIDAAHRCQRNNGDFDNAIGFARGRRRLASPIYISVLKSNNKYTPIITKLNARNLTQNEKNLQNTFINEILNLNEQ